MTTKEPSKTAPAPAVETTTATASSVSLPPDKGGQMPAAVETPVGNEPAINHRVIVSDETVQAPRARVPVVTLDMTKPIDAELNIDKDTVVYLLYLLYRTNMIARNNLRNMIDQISKPLPDNVLKWLVNEAAKAGR